MSEEDARRKPLEPPPADQFRGVDAYLRILADHYNHQDRLIWARIPYIITLSAVILGTSFWVRATWPEHHHLPYIILALGAIYTYVLLVLTSGNIENRNINRPLLDQILAQYLDTGIQEIVRAHVHTERQKCATSNQVLKPRPWLVLFAVPEERTLYFRGGIPRGRAISLLPLVIWSCIIIDLAVMGLFLVGWQR